MPRTDSHCYIFRVSRDILLSSSGPVIMRAEVEDESIQDIKPYEYWKEPATVVLWRWLGMDRFFPPKIENIPQRIRGCASVSIRFTSKLLDNDTMKDKT